MLSIFYSAVKTKSISVALMVLLVSCKDYKFFLLQFVEEFVI